jgi:hypothetical protein
MCNILIYIILLYLLTTLAVRPWIFINLRGSGFSILLATYSLPHYLCNYDPIKRRQSTNFEPLLAKAINE